MMRLIWKIIVVGIVVSILLTLIIINDKVWLYYNSYQPDKNKKGWIKCNVIADNYICAYKTEQNDNLGGRSYLRLKGIEDIAILKFDMSAVEGMTVEEAELYLHKKENDLLLVGVSTIAADWVEGNNKRYTPQVGASCFNYAQYDKIPWAYPNSDFTDVIFGAGNSIYTYTKPKLVNGWYVISIPPELIHALIIGEQYGLAISDEKGQIRIKKTVHSRESRFPPFLLVKGKREDIIPPDPVPDFKVEMDKTVDNKIWLIWTSAGDDNTHGRAFGYNIRYGTTTCWETAYNIDHWQIPRKPDAFGRFYLPIEDIKPDTMYYFGIQAYDEAGNTSPVVYTSFKLPRMSSPIKLVDMEFLQPKKVPFIPISGNGKICVWAVSDLEKVHPVTGNVLHDGSYSKPPMYTLQRGNFIWDAKHKTVKLHGAQNEIIGFQIIIEAMGKELKDIVITPNDLIESGGGIIKKSKNIKLFKLWYVPVNGVYYPDACIPLNGNFSIPDKNNNIPDQKIQAIWVDIYIPKNSPAGVYESTWYVSCKDIPKPVGIKINITVWDFMLPDVPTFINELNAYSGIAKGLNISRGSSRYRRMELAYHQLARWHRSTLNILPYGQDGSIRSGDYIPVVEGIGKTLHVKSWKEWDKRFGLYLDGSAFTEAYGYYGPGMGIPLTHIYLPFHENWPANIHKGYNVKIDTTTYPELIYEHARKAPPIEKAFLKDYKAVFVKIVSEYAKHFEDMGWNNTYFQFYLNNKYYAKKPDRAGKPGAGTSWWLLDEPKHRDDFLALAFFGKLFWQGVDKYKDNVKFDFRVDISRPQYQRGILDNIATCMVVSANAFFRKYRLCMDRKRIFGEKYWFYGGGADIDEPGVNLIALYYNAWMLGADGGLPYYTSFPKPYCWRKGEYLAIVYPHVNGPVAGLRLKIERRAVQDIEYLNILSNLPGWNREKVVNALMRRMNIKGDVKYSHVDIPGRIIFPNLKPIDFEQLRINVAKTILWWQ